MAPRNDGLERLSWTPMLPKASPGPHSSPGKPVDGGNVTQEHRQVLPGLRKLWPRLTVALSPPTPPGGKVTQCLVSYTSGLKVRLREVIHLPEATQLVRDIAGSGTQASRSAALYPRAQLAQEPCAGIQKSGFQSTSESHSAAAGLDGQPEEIRFHL